MNIKILTSCSGLDFSYAEGEMVDVQADIAKDLINAGYAEEIKTAARTKKKAEPAREDDSDPEQMSFFDAVTDQDVLDEIQNIDVQNLTPLEALNELYRLQNKLKNRWRNT